MNLQYVHIEHSNSLHPTARSYQYLSLCTLIKHGENSTWLYANDWSESTQRAQWNCCTILQHNCNCDWVSVTKIRAQMRLNRNAASLLSPPQDSKEYFAQHTNYKLDMNSASSRWTAPQDNIQTRFYPSCKTKCVLRIIPLQHTTYQTEAYNLFYLAHLPNAVACATWK